MPRILFIRGGAIGDFVLTLPAIGLAREAFPAAQIEALGYKHIVELGVGRRYLDAARSIEYGPLAGFFSRNNILDADLCDYFTGFQQIVSYLYDPDKHFECNLRRCGVKNFLAAHPIVGDGDHAARQLARPLESLALYLEDHAAHLYPSDADFSEVDALLTPAESGVRRLLIHPGSGGVSKNWPRPNWIRLIGRLLDREPGLQPVIVCGEADDGIRSALEHEFCGRAPFVTSPPLTILAALAARCGRFLGHDSGVSHIAAAAGARCLLLFGPTDPDVWAPANPLVRVLRAPEGELARLELETVLEALRDVLG